MPLKQTPVNEDTVYIVPPLVSALTGCDCSIIVRRKSLRMSVLIRNIQLVLFKTNVMSVAREKVQETGKKLRKLRQEAGEYSTHTSTDTNTVHKY